MNQLEKDILERLKKLRKDHSFSQLEVAQKLGFNSPIGYNKIEKGLTDLKINLFGNNSEIEIIKI